MEEFALIKSRVNLNRVNEGIALISDLKVYNTLWQNFMVVGGCIQRLWPFSYGGTLVEIQNFFIIIMSILSKFERK